MNKEDIRGRVKARKSLLSEAEKALAAERVFNCLEECAAFTMAENILLYHSLPDELSTRAFLAKWAGRKHFFLPRVNGVNLEILPYNQSTLRLGAFQIEEPDGNDLTPVSEMELVVVPAIAYDRHCNRLGRGRGYYDRLLATVAATKIGIGYDFQLLLDDDLPTSPHDIPVDIVITDHRLLRCRH